MTGKLSYRADIDGLRAVAVLAVIASHLPEKFLPSGFLGVDMFFVLSGFLLSQPWFKSALDTTATRPSIANFYTARALRVLPLYYIVVLVSMALSENWLTGARALLFDFVGFEIFPYSVVWWTLSTEVQFYVLLPLLLSLWFSSNVGRTVCVVLFLGWLYLYAVLTLSTASEQTSFPFLVYKSLFARWPAFLVGILAGYVYLRARVRMQVATVGKGMQLASLVLCGLALYCLGRILQTVANLGGVIAEHEWHIHHTYESILWGILLLLLLLGRPVGKGILVNRAMAITGKLSYSIYLVHVPVLFYLIYPTKMAMGSESYLSSAQLYSNPLIALILTMALSYASYRLIEVPFLNLKKRLSQ